MKETINPEEEVVTPAVMAVETVDVAEVVGETDVINLEV